jgi:hypothetical protein
MGDQAVPRRRRSERENRLPEAVKSTDRRIAVLKARLSLVSNFEVPKCTVFSFKFVFGVPKYTVFSSKIHCKFWSTKIH